MLLECRVVVDILSEGEPKARDQNLYSRSNEYKWSQIFVSFFGFLITLPAWVRTEVADLGMGTVSSVVST